MAVTIARNAKQGKAMKDMKAKSINAKSMKAKSMKAQKSMNAQKSMKAKKSMTSKKSMKAKSTKAKKSMKTKSMKVMKSTTKQWKKNTANHGTDFWILSPPYSNWIRELWNSRELLRMFMHKDKAPTCRLKWSLE